MNIENASRRPWLVFGAVAVATIALGWLGLRQVDRMRGGVDVWVASAGLVPGAVIGPGDVKQVRRRSDAVDNGAIRSRGDIQGRTLARRKQEGAEFVDSDFVREAQQTDSPGLSSFIPEGRVLIPIRVTPLQFRMKSMRLGDRLDILAASQNEAGRVVVRDAYHLGYNRPETVQSARAAPTGPFGIALQSTERPQEAPMYMYIAVHPEDALPLSEAIASREALRFVMHARSDVRAGRVSDLGADSRQVVEMIVGGEREQVTVAY